MIIGTRGSILRLLWWQKRNVLLLTALAGVVPAIAQVGGLAYVKLPTLPLAVAGAALGIFVSFRTNSCYDRWWEGRKLWGRLINTSRHLALQTRAYLGPERSAEQQRIVRRHLAYVNTLRCLLREQSPSDDESVLAYLPEGEGERLRKTNATAMLLDAQMTDLIALNTSGALGDLRLHSMDQSIRELLDIQGGCERIKKTPLPRIYGYVTQRLIQWFGVLLPAGLVAELGWMSMPITVLVVIGFNMINEAGRVLEDPFTTFWNALPLSAMSRTIEQNLLELLGEENIPPPVQPNPPFVLM